MPVSKKMPCASAMRFSCSRDLVMRTCFDSASRMAPASLVSTSLAGTVATTAPVAPKMSGSITSTASLAAPASVNFTSVLAAVLAYADRPLNSFDHASLATFASSALRVAASGDTTITSGCRSADATARPRRASSVIGSAGVASPPCPGYFAATSPICFTMSAVSLKSSPGPRTRPLVASAGVASGVRMANTVFTGLPCSLVTKAASCSFS